MKYTIYLLSLIVITISSSSCINNDFPLPYIKGEVLEFEVDGQKSAKIDPSKNIIKLEMSDTVDLRAANLEKFAITTDASAPIKQGDKVNLTKDTIFTITTYQEYKWIISVTQEINRNIKVSGQIGEAVIDVDNCIAVVKVSPDQSLFNIVVEEMQLGRSNSETYPDPVTISNFSSPQKFLVTSFGETEEWTVSVQLSKEIVTTGNVDAWGLFANLAGAVQPNNPNEGGFEYQKAGDATWQYIKGEVVGSSLTAKIVGLTPNTSYNYRAKLGEALGADKTFKTETTPLIENLSFDSWSQDGKKMYPNATGGNSFWATGNEGVVLAGKTSNATPVEGAEAVKGKAAKLETIGKVMLAGIAAGNMFTGIYKSGTPPAFADMKKLVVFGRPYTGRPTKLRGWYKYTPKLVNIAADKDFQFPDAMNKPDWCNIYIRLENWGDATERPENAALITEVASGDFRSDKETAAYTQFEIDIVYKTTTVKPTHVVLVATSSINGGDFCGGVGSTLWVDEFELLFD